MPAELGLVEVDTVLRAAHLRDKVKLRCSGSFKTAKDVTKAAILGADLFEFGTTAMLAVGCKMQRTCNKSCEPGVATDGEKFKGQQHDVESYFLNLAADIQQELKSLGLCNLEQLKGRKDLLYVIDNKIAKQFDFSPLLSEYAAPKLHEKYNIGEKQKFIGIDSLCNEEITEAFADNKAFESRPIKIESQQRAFGGAIAGQFYQQLEDNPNLHIKLHTYGNAGQKYGFLNAKGMVLEHSGPVQDGSAESMTGGEIIVITPKIPGYAADKNTIAGNAFCYGASGGSAFVNGIAGHRFAIRNAGAQIVAEGAGEFPCEYMTDGTVCLLGDVGNGLGAGASGGIIFVYNANNKNAEKLSDSVRLSTPDENDAYKDAICTMLQEHYSKTKSVKAGEILNKFSKEFANFNIVIPLELDKINSLKAVLDIFATYSLRQSKISIGMQVWLEQKCHKILSQINIGAKIPDDLAANLGKLSQYINDNPKMSFSNQTKEELKEKISKLRKKITATAPSLKDFKSKAEQTAIIVPNIQAPVISAYTSIEKRLSNVNGVLDKTFKDALDGIASYVAVLYSKSGGCSTCWAHSCSGVEVDTGCPSEKPINSINAKLQQIGPIKDGKLSTKQWNILRTAFELQISKTPFIAFTGAACPAPCQDACTETIPNKTGKVDTKRSGKSRGEPVHIKDIEYHLYQLGRFMGWFEEKPKKWNANEQEILFGGSFGQANYNQTIANYIPAFQRKREFQNKEIIIIGSGPAAMESAFCALRDGVKVRMYEKSDKAGGLLMDGIPAHKFDKEIVDWHFARLKEMGLQLHLNSEVKYHSNSKQFLVNNKIIALGDQENQHIILCPGAGKPINLPQNVTQNLSQKASKRIIQAVHFLKAANDVAYSMKQNPHQDVEELIVANFGEMDPRGKRIVVVGGGDTAQDAIRVTAKYLNSFTPDKNAYLNILVRGNAQSDSRTVMDNYPANSEAKTPENQLRDEEVSYIGASNRFLASPDKIEEAEDGTLKISVKHSTLVLFDEIQKGKAVKQLYDGLPRDAKPTIIDTTQGDAGFTELETDMVILAVGFGGKEGIPLITDTGNLTNVSISGDASETQDWIIIGAARSGRDTYENKVVKALDVEIPPPYAIKMQQMAK